MAGVKQWWPHNAPIYDIAKSYADNAAEGPFFVGDIPARVWTAKENWIDFLGYKIASPLGVPAGPLLNSKWTTLAARLGFDVVTYKTIRSNAHPGHSLPNVVYIQTHGDLTRERWSETVTMVDNPPTEINDIAITNSFGMPSREAEFLYTDIKKARDELEEGQLLIVSVVGSASDKKDFVDDYIRAAKIAVDAGAPVIEANFSCPNVVTGEGKIYSNPVAVEEIASSLVKAIGNIPLLIKVGVFDDKDQMRAMFKAAARAGVKGISGINTLSMKVINSEGQPALGPARVLSGICGGPIRAAALDWVHAAREIITQENLPLALTGCGGIMKPEQFDDFLHAGVDVAMSATGMMWDPLLALRYHNTHNKI